MATDYITLDELKATLQVTGGAMDADLARAITASSRAVEKACSRRGLRRFWADTAPVERLYTAADPDLLEIHDAYEVTLVESDEDGDGTYERQWGANEWVAVPLNAALDGEPYTALHWRPGTAPDGTPSSGFPANRLAAVRVTAKHGWETVPAFVPQAVLLLASRLAKRSREAPFAVVGFADSAAAMHIARTDPDVTGLIHDYIRDASVRSLRLG